MLFRSSPRRRLFANWADIFHGLLDDHLLIAPYMASIVSSLLCSSSQQEQSTWLFRFHAHIFGLMLLVESCDSSLYWHTTAAHLGPVLQQLGADSFSVCEEQMEATFRPVKDWHRNRSNHRGTRDLEILRAVDLAHQHIAKEYGEHANNNRNWPVAVARDLLFAPCVTGTWVHSTFYTR